MGHLTKFAYSAYVLLRVMAGSMFICHGAQKVLGLLGGARLHPQFWTGGITELLWIGGLIELLGGLAITLGLFTRWAAFICSGQMAVAYFMFHWKFKLGLAFFPVVNKGELAVLYCFVFLLIACNGGVKWCLDKEG